MPSPESKKRNLEKLRKFFCRKWVIITLVLSLLPVIAVATFLIRYYYIFDAAIEAKLGNRLSLAATKFYSAPAVIYPGKQISPSELESRLRRLGYMEDTGIQGISYYRVETDDLLLIYNDPSVPVDSDRHV